MKILVIDDERPTLAMFKLFLTTYGHEVITAENGDQGLEIFASQGPDIVFTDIRMPGMGGLEILRQIRESGLPCQVIIITGYGDLEGAMVALDLAASDFIKKPVERAALNSALALAEKRLSQTGPDEFSSIARLEGQCLTLVFGGRLSQAAAIEISGIDLATVPGNHIHILLKDSFSMSRSGLSLLKDFLRQTAALGLRVVMSGMSYNYIRLFEMSGVDKLAILIPECLEETEL